MEYSEQEKEEALKRRDLSALTNMLNDGVDVNSLVVPKNTDILLAAINKGNKAFFKYVLSKGFQCKNKNGFLYVHHSIRTHDIFFLKKIVEQYSLDKLNYNEYTSSKDNCLHIACGENNISADILKYLTDCEIKWNEKNKFGQTPLHILLIRHNTVTKEMLDILKNHLSIFSIKDKMNVSPLDLVKINSLSSVWVENNQEIFNFIKEAF